MLSPSIKTKKQLDHTQKKHRKWIMIAILLVICGIIAISGLNEPFLSPFSNAVRFNYPIDLAFSNEKSAIIDSQGKRLLIFNEKNELTALVDTGLYGSPVDGFSSVCIGEDRIYAIGYKRFNQGFYIAEEKVVSYDFKGNYKQTLYSHAYQENEYVNCPGFSDITAKDGGLYITENKGKALSFIRINQATGSFEQLWKTELPETLYSSTYIPSMKKIFILGRSQNCYYIDELGNQTEHIEMTQVLNDIIQSENLQIPGIEEVDVKSLSCYPVLTYEKNGEVNGLVFIDRTSGEVKAFYDDSTENWEAVYYSTGFCIKNLLHWLSLVILALTLFTLLIWALIKKSTQNSRKVILLIGVILLTSVFYSAMDQKNGEEVFTQNMITQTQQLGLLLSKDYGDHFKSITQSGVISYCRDHNHQKSIDEDQELLRDLSIANGTSNGLMIDIYLIDKQENAYTYVDSRNWLPSGEIIQISDEVRKILLENGEYQAITSETAWETYVYDYCFLKDSKDEIVGILCISALRGNLDYLLKENSINLFLTLVCIFIGLYVSKTVIQTFWGDFKKMRKKERKDIRGKGLDMAGVFRFLQQCLYGIDAIILVYVSKSLCSGMDAEKQAVMAALPLAVFFAGRLLGGIFFNPLNKYIGEKTVVLSSILFSALSFGLIIYAITVKNIYYLIIARFILGIFLGGMLFYTTETLPMSARSDEMKKKSLGSMLRADAGAGIIAQLLGGLLAEYISYQAIYQAGILFCIPMFILSCMIFESRKQKRQAEPEYVEKASIKGSWKVFFKPQMLMYLGFFVIPAILADGYQSYLFPMYTSGAGLSVMFLTNISVFCKTSSYVIGPHLGKFTSKFDDHTLLIAPNVVIAAALICFLISPNIYWAVLMLFIYDLVRRIPNLPRRLYVIETANRYHLDSGMIQANYQAIEAAILTIQSPILSGFLALGINLACAALGMVNMFLTGIWGFYLNKRKK